MKRTQCIILMALLFTTSALAVEAGFVSIFNEKDLTGWEGDGKLWVVEDGLLIGRSPGIGHNDFLATEKVYGDFILHFQVRLVEDKGNSGVQFRSKKVPNSHEVSGYQADIGPGWWGNLYDESRRNKTLVSADKDVLKEALQRGEWNDYEIRAIGGKIILKINDSPTVVYSEEDMNIASEGMIALQIHSGPPMEVQFKNIRIKEIATK